MRTLGGEGGVAVGSMVELHSEADQAIDCRSGLVREGSDGEGIAESGAGADGICGVDFGVVEQRDRRCDATLGSLGVGLLEGGLADQGDIGEVGGQEGGVDAGQSAADDEDVLGRAHVWIR